MPAVGAIDDGVAPKSCSTACGSGKEYCTNGVYTNCDAPNPKSETCNGKDDDCNGWIDEYCKEYGASCANYYECASNICADWSAYGAPAVCGKYCTSSSQCGSESCCGPFGISGNSICTHPALAGQYCDPCGNGACETGETCLDCPEDCACGAWNDVTPSLYYKANAASAANGCSKVGGLWPAGWHHNGSGGLPDWTWSSTCSTAIGDANSYAGYNARWTLSAGKAGKYEIYVWSPSGDVCSNVPTGYAAEVKYVVYFAAGSGKASSWISQASGQGTWKSLKFDGQGYITLPIGTHTLWLSSCLA